MTHIIICNRLLCTENQTERFTNTCIQQHCLGASCDIGSTISQDSWASMDYTILNSHIYDSYITSADTAQMIKSSSINGRYLRNVSMRNQSIKNYWNMFTWFDKEHIIFKLMRGCLYLKWSGYSNYLVVHFDLKTSNDIKLMYDHTYIAKFNDGYIQAVWDVNDKKPLDEYVLNIHDYVR